MSRMEGDGPYFDKPFSVVGDNEFLPDGGYCVLDAKRYNELLTSHLAVERGRAYVDSMDDSPASEHQCRLKEILR